MAGHRENENFQGEDLDILYILRAVLRKWWLVAMAGLLFAMAAYVYRTEQYSPLYTAEATFAVSASGSGTTVYSDLTAASSLADVFAQVLNSSVLKERVSQEIGLENFDGRIEASLIPETNLLNLRVTAATPSLAFRMIDAIIENHSIVTDEVIANAVLTELKAPTVPNAPTAPLQRRSTVIKAGALGAALVVLSIGVYCYLQDVVKNEREAEERLDMKLLASVPHERRPRDKRTPLIVSPLTGFSFVESFRLLGTKTGQAMEDGKQKLLLITSAGEGEGKSTVATNLALALAKRGKRTLLVDGDLLKPSQYGIFRQKIPKERQLLSVIGGGGLPLIHPHYKKLHLLLCESGPKRAAELADSELRQYLERVRDAYDVVLIDTPPISVGTVAENIAQYAEACILVVREGASRIGDINEAGERLEKGGCSILGCVFNDAHAASLGEAFGSYGYGSGYGHGRYGYGRGR